VIPLLSYWSDCSFFHNVSRLSLFLFSPPVWIPHNGPLRSLSFFKVWSIDSLFMNSSLSRSLSTFSVSVMVSDLDSLVWGYVFLSWLGLGLFLDHEDSLGGFSHHPLFQRRFSRAHDDGYGQGRKTKRVSFYKSEGWGETKRLRLMSLRRLSTERRETSFLLCRGVGWFSRVKIGSSILKVTYMFACFCQSLVRFGLGILPERCLQ